MKFRLLVTTAGYTTRYIVSEITFKCQLDLYIIEELCARISLQVTVTTKDKEKHIQMYFDNVSNE